MMRFGSFRNNKRRCSNLRGSHYTFRSIEQLEDRRLLTNAPPNLAAINNTTSTTGTELVIQLNVTDAETSADQLFVFFDPDETPVTNATVDNATKTFHWTPTAAQVGDFRFVILATDRPAGGSPALADAEEFTVTVAAANQPPVNTVPTTAQTTAEDTDLVFAATSNNLISIADPDAGTADAEVTLTATNGTLTLSTLTGLTFSAGDGAGDAQATFSGSIAAINAALAGLKFTPNSNFSGAASIAITTDDLGHTGAGGAKTDTDTVTINVTPVADTPGVTHATTNEDTQTTSDLVITRNAADGPEVTHLKITDITNGTLFLNDGVTPITNGTFITFDQALLGLRFTPAANFVGTASFNLQASTSATDAGLGGGVDNAFITVLPVNDAPSLAAIAAQTVERGSPLTFTATASDVDAGSALTFSLDPDLESFGATIDPATGAFSWTPSGTQALGPTTFRIIVVDNGDPALADSETFTVTVTDDNTMPSLAAISDQTVAEGSELSVTAQGTDPDAGDVLSYSLVAGQFPTGATIDAQTGVFRWTPTEGQGPGTHSVTIMVSDNRDPAGTATRTFMVTVSEVNQPPVLSAIDNPSGVVGTPITFTATATDADLPANALGFSLSNNAPEGATINSGTGEFTWTPTAAGTFTFNVIVTDDGAPALSAQREITITVAAQNSAPVFTSTAVTAATEDQLYTYNITVTDADADTLTLSPPTKPDWLTFTDNHDGTATLTGTPANDDVGDHAIVLVANDGTDNTLQEFTIAVANVNDAPAFTSAEITTATQGQVYTYNIVTTDPDTGATLTITSANTPGWLTFTDHGDGTATLTGTPTNADVGAHPISMQVSDGTAQATQSFTINVANVNDPPVLNQITNPSGTVGTPITFTATANDPDGDNLLFSLQGAPAGANINSDTGEFSWTPATAGDFTFSVVVTDDGNPAASDQQEITVTVT